jgi:hypothetical protein
MEFTHPVVRGSKIWETKLKSGKTKNILIAVTNAELDKNKKNYNKIIIDRLVQDIEHYINKNKEIDGYALANRMRDWENTRDH